MAQVGFNYGKPLGKPFARLDLRRGWSYPAQVAMNPEMGLRAAASSR